MGLKYGIEYTQFWDLSLEEIGLILHARMDYLTEQQHSTILSNFALAQNIAICVGRALNGKQLPTAEETYPELFKDTKPEEEIAEDDPRIWQMHRDQMLALIDYKQAKKKALQEQERGVNSN